MVNFKAEAESGLRKTEEESLSANGQNPAVFQKGRVISKESPACSRDPRYSGLTAADFDQYRVNTAFIDWLNVNPHTATTGFSYVKGTGSGRRRSANSWETIATGC